MRTLVWYRGKDLRVAHHGPLRDAVEKGEALSVFYGTCPPESLRDAVVVLGETYPRPVVDHSEARARFLAITSVLDRPRPSGAQRRTQ